MKLSKHLLYLLLALPCLSFGRQVQDTLNFNTLDSIARTYQYKGDLKLLASQLTDGYDTDLLKARAIFAWVTDNVAYDVKAFNKHKSPKPFKCRKNKDCETQYLKWENDYIDVVLNDKKAVCQGYAVLFKRMCDYAGLQTDIVSGYVKSYPSQVGKMGVLDHAWNGIMLNGTYYFVDVTWAAGYCTTEQNGKLKEFIKHTNNYYWLTPTDKFLRNHYPKSKTPHTTAANKIRYKNTPFIVNWLLPHLDILLPQSGIIEAKLCDTIKISFRFDDGVYAIDKMQVNTNKKRNPGIWRGKEKNEINQNALKKQQYIDYAHDGDIFSFDYIIEDKNIKYIEVFVNQRYTILKFNIKVKE